MATATRKAPPRARKAPSRSSSPSLREERRLLRDGGHRLLAAVDEVGRGALAGPVTVGVVLIDEATRSAPSGVRDSKLLTPAARQALVPKLRRWAPRHAVGHAEPAEIDRFGIIAALRLAARRALAALPEAPDCVLLDGSHDWLSVPVTVLPEPERPVQVEALFDLPPEAARLGPVAPAIDLRAGGAQLDLSAVRETPDLPGAFAAPVVTRVKADMRCAAVAAASVLAKVERDAIMVELAGRHPEYAWHENKGYSAPEHIEALRRFGATPLHRRSWSLPGTEHAVLPF
ncbi:ribonuclease HII [Spongisporangium articulatum]|uniref:Ribonuclease n=1 Tax=Spongisporangium articulatum TaxID=3362603 RepID=A0ABW8AN34_9ACTN